MVKIKINTILTASLIEFIIRISMRNNEFRVGINESTFSFSKKLLQINNKITIPEMLKMILTL